MVSQNNTDVYYLIELNEITINTGTGNDTVVTRETLTMPVTLLLQSIGVNGLSTIVTTLPPYDGTCMLPGVLCPSPDSCPFRPGKRVVQVHVRPDGEQYERDATVDQHRN